MTDNKEAYVENLIERPNSAILSLINFIDYKYLDHAKKHLTIKRGMLEDKLTSLKK
jgi:hypothetical protein